MLTITQRERNRPVTLEDALDRLSDPRAKLLVNSQSGRAAVQVPSPSVMLDDGEVERRVRLIRPMEHPSLALAMMPQTHWQEADRETFARAWTAELADVPEFTDSQIHIVSGLLAADLEASAERIVSRLSAPDRRGRAHRRPQGLGGLGGDRARNRPDSLSPEGAFAALIEGKTILDLSEGLQLRRVRVMGVNRIELTGFTDMMRDRLRAYGLFGEIISWKLRMFVPTDASGPEVLGKVLERYPLERIAERAAA